MVNSLRAGWISAALYFLSVPVLGQQAPVSPCDLSGDGAVNAGDAQVAVNMTLGVTPCTANIIGPGICNVVVIQRVVNSFYPDAGGPCVIGTPKSVTLTWVASPSVGVVGYEINRSVNAGGPYTPVNASPVAATTYSDSIVENGRTYYYVVKAVNASGQQSGPSNEAAASIPTT